MEREGEKAAATRNAKATKSIGAAQVTTFFQPSFASMSSSKATDSDGEDDVTNFQFKVILLGDGAVGKTSIATRFSENNFSQNYKQTVGVDFFMKRINLQGR